MYFNGSSYLDQQYILKISHNLKLFKQLSPDNYVCRCSICGDSKKSEYKTRFHILRKNNNWFTYCHNCNWSAPFSFFMKLYYPQLYSEYLTERYKPEKKEIINPATILQESLSKYDPDPDIDTFNYSTDYFIRFIDLIESHPARQYVTKRGILNEDIWYTKNFGQMIKRLDSNLKYEKFYTYEYPRLILPFWNLKGQSLIFQARSFGSEYVRYITIKRNENEPKIFGLDRLDLEQEINVVEGPIDSFFMPNCIAMGGSSASSLPDELKDLIFIFDNEPRNREIHKQMDKKIQEGHKIFIPGLDWKHKDLNDAYIAGISKRSIAVYVKSNTYVGVMAKLKMARYKK